jgi:hypothetical protein
MREVERAIRDLASVSSPLTRFRNMFCDTSRYFVSIKTKPVQPKQLIGDEVCIVACGA